MEKVTSFFLNSILHKKVYDEDNDYIGKLMDIYVTTDDNFPRIIGYKIKKSGEILNYEFKSVDFFGQDSKIKIKVREAREIIPRTYSYLLSENLLNKKIVDINGKKLVRVNDLRIALIAGEYKVIAVDTGILGASRRYGMEKTIQKLMKLFNSNAQDTIVMWDNVQSIEMVNNNLQLSESYKKLSKLHPADIADILEDIDTGYRKKIFESLDDDFAADVLEEFEPEIQADILESLSEDKRYELLESIPNDEIADMLDEVDEETAEKILLDMEKDDADEVRTLMKYKEETVGSVMNTDFIAFNVNITVEETLSLFKEIQPEEEVSYYIYITNENEKLLGIIPLRDLILSDGSSRLMDIMKKDVVNVKDSDNVQEAIEVSIKYNLLTVPVVDEEEKLCGVVIVNDLLDDIVPNRRRKIKKAL